MLIPQQVDRLAQRLGLTASGVATDSVERLKTHLAYRSDWLLVFDNAERVEDVAPFRPATGGNIVVTSRYPGWGALEGRLQVDVPDRSETVSLLLERLPSTPPDLADRLAAELGDLPLAVAQAAAYMEQTGMDPGSTFGSSLIAGRRCSPAAMSSITMAGSTRPGNSRWRSCRPSTHGRWRSCNSPHFLAPEPIPLKLFAKHESATTDESDFDELSDAVGAAVSFSLIQRLPDGSNFTG